MAKTATATAEAEDVREVRVRRYELLAIVPNKYTEDEVPQIQKTIGALIEKVGGKTVKEINYGKRRLAYPIKHNHYGYYLLTHFDLDAEQVRELDSYLRVQDEVIRYLITFALPEGSLPKEAGDLHAQEEPKREEKPEEKRSNTMKKPSITDAQATDAERQKMAKGTAFDLEKELGVTAEEAKKSLEESGKEKSKKDESVDLAGLDSKLDEIMGDLEK